MKYFFLSIILFTTLVNQSCKTTKNINKAIAKKDTVAVAVVSNAADSIAAINNGIQKLKNNYINFKTFSAKIKVDYDDSKGKKQDVTANVE